MLEMRGRDLALSGVLKKTVEDVDASLPYIVIQRVMTGYYRVTAGGPYIGCDELETRMLYIVKYLEECVLPLVDRSIDVSCAFNILLEDCPSDERLMSTRSRCFIFGCRTLDHVHVLLPEYGYMDMSKYEGVEEDKVPVDRKIRDRVLCVLDYDVDGVGVIDRVMSELDGSKTDYYVLMREDMTRSVFDLPSLEGCDWINRCRGCLEFKALSSYGEVMLTHDVYMRYLPMLMMLNGVKVSVIRGGDVRLHTWHDIPMKSLFKHTQYTRLLIHTLLVYSRIVKTNARQD